MSPWIWGIGALFLAFLELQAPGLYFIWIALGAAITGLVAFRIEESLETQLVIFAAASACSSVLGYFVYKRTIRVRPGEPTLNLRDLQLVGARGVVAERFKNGQGKIRVGDSVWLAEGPDLSEGTPVVIMAMRGTTAIVMPAD
jgi:membrane protein implicated in regulation of membrane protease activity